jgi:hypothetical protein
MSDKITVFPKNVNVVGISTLTSPVTQTAEVEMKNASVKDMPLYVAEGNNRSNVPMTINRIKLARNSTEGLYFCRNFKLFFDISIKKMIMFVPTRYIDSIKLYQSLKIFLK